MQQIEARRRATNLPMNSTEGERRPLLLDLSTHAGQLCIICGQVITPIMSQLWLVAPCRSGCLEHEDWGEPPPFWFVRSWGNYRTTKFRSFSLVYL